MSNPFFDRPIVNSPYEYPRAPAWGARWNGAAHRTSDRHAPPGGIQLYVSGVEPGSEFLADLAVSW